MIQLKYHIQYVSKFGKLSGGHRTGKGQFSSQSKEGQCHRMLKLPCNCAHVTCWQRNVQISFSSTLTKSLQMYKLGLEKAEEAEIKLLTSGALLRKLNSSRETPTSVH